MSTVQFKSARDGDEAYISALITCPYCETEQGAWLDDHPHPQVRLCDIDQRGCDKYFVVRLGTRRIDIEYMKLVETGNG